MDLRRTVFPEFPKRNHPLQWLVNVNPVNLEEQIGMMVDGKKWYGVATAENIAVYKQRLRYLRIRDLNDASRALLRERWRQMESIWLVALARD